MAKHLTRKKYQGVLNIVQFNWHFYLLAVIVMGLLWLAIPLLNSTFALLTYLVLGLALVSTVGSLLVSFYVYDLSTLYQLDWLEELLPTQPQQIVNIHAGFDETSGLLAQQYPQAQLHVFDFYDAKKHTEISIQRARKVYPPYPNTQTINTNDIPLQDNSIDLITNILAAHEIRNEDERSLFFSLLQQKLTSQGQIIVVEHLRDVPNFLAYQVGFFHFLPKESWHKNFAAAKLKIVKTSPITPFITVFVLAKAM
jgi:hypothetical protein